MVKLMAMIRDYGQCYADDLPSGAANELIAIENELRQLLDELEHLRALTKGQP